MYVYVTEYKETCFITFSIQLKSNVNILTCGTT
jgi:hypothetical protein